jgi:predicted RNA binding protein YcfA (HicA-like mRNA interferase family)
VAQFPSMKASALLGVLMNEPLGYSIARQKGSHRVLRAPDMPQLLFSYHDGATVPPGVVRKYLVKIIGLSEDDALALL